jgi:hypothetical protein
LKFKLHLQPPSPTTSSHRRRLLSSRRIIYCKLKLPKSLRIEFEGEC